jgi:uridine kinase
MQYGMIENDKKGIDDLHKLNVWRRYQSTLAFILYVATKKLFPASRLRIDHSIGSGLYCVLGRKLTRDDLRGIDAEMRKIIEENIPIQRTVRSRSEAIRLFQCFNLNDKITLLKNICIKNITLYTLLDFYDIYAVPPFKSTGQAPLFYLKNFPPGFVIVCPTWHDLSKLPTFIPQPRLAKIFNEYGEWVRILGISDLGELNYTIKHGAGSEVVKVSEALHEKKIVYIADRITREHKRLVLIAGPSSAGKTTFTKRLAIQLLVNGLSPLIISVDNYFLPHSKTPKDKYGRLDFESIRAVDIPLLNRDLLKIIEGKRVVVPKFNFLTGRRNRGNTVSLPEDGIVLLEGIHSLNEKLTYKVPKLLKFKIYISALTQLNIDDHNRISTTDTRMMRRIVRDTHFRGYKVHGVLNHWTSVRVGEERNIYPFQNEADEMFNSALVYEPSVLKKFCEPLLKRVKEKNGEYEEAQRLLDFFKLFYELDKRDVPSNSILREFIGGSSFVY